jgi:hypothetical protein
LASDKLACGQWSAPINTSSTTINSEVQANITVCVAR